MNIINVYTCTAVTIRGVKRPFQVTNSTLEVDFGALAVALNSIPLHRRLDISPDNVHVSICPP